MTVWFPNDTPDECMEYVRDLERRSFTIEELQAISRILEHHYVPYEDEKAHEVLRRIDSIIREADDMATDSSQTTQ